MLIKNSLILVGITSVLIVACSSNPSPQRVAKEAAPPQVLSNTESGTVSPVSVPADLNSENFQNTYNVPQIPQANNEGALSLTPPGSTVEQVAAAAPAQKSAAVARSAGGGNVGLSANMEYAQTWKKLGKALPQAGYPVVEQDSSSGTYYVLDKVSSGGVIKRNTPIYQVRLQKGSGNSTLITVLNAQNQTADSSVSSRILGAVKGHL